MLDAFKPQKQDKTELSIVFDYYGNLCKARFDMLQNNVIIDLKTCRDASPKGFKQAIRIGVFNTYAVLIPVVDSNSNR